MFEVSVDLAGLLEALLRKLKTYERGTPEHRLGQAVLAYYQDKDLSAVTPEQKLDPVHGPYCTNSIVAGQATGRSHIYKGERIYCGELVGHKGPCQHTRMI